MIAEFNQQVDGINLAAKDSLTLGDFFLRMNHLLHDCVDERYRLHYGDIQQYVFMCWLQSLEASGLTRRLLPSTPLDSANQDDWLKVCNITLNGLSGGEQQRLRLASLIFVEKIKYEVYCGKLSKDVFGALSLHPVQLLLLDEPDQFIDQNFFSVLSNLLKCLDEEHRQVLSIVVVVHKEVSELTLSSKEIDLPMRLRQLQISAPSDVDHDGSNITKTFSLIRCVS